MDVDSVSYYRTPRRRSPNQTIADYIQDTYGITVSIPHIGCIRRKLKHTAKEDIIWLPPEGRPLATKIEIIKAATHHLGLENCTDRFLYEDGELLKTESSH